MKNVNSFGERTSGNAMSFANEISGAEKSCVNMPHDRFYSARSWSQRIGALVLMAVLVTLPSFASAQESAIWKAVRYNLFGTQTILEDVDGQVIALTAPKRAMDAAVVPISIVGLVPQNADRYIQKIWLVIDGNPSPIGAEFTLTPESGRASIETRVRINNPGHVRAIAQLNDGAIYHVSSHVQASGGCSVPAAKDPNAVDPDLGEIRLRLRGRPVLGRSVAAQLMIKHPNSSGLAVNPVTKKPQMAHFVRDIQVEYAGKTVLSAKVDFSISENPNFRFWLKPEKDGAITATVIDSEDRKFSQTLEITSVVN